MKFSWKGRQKIRENFEGHKPKVQARSWTNLVAKSWIDSRKLRAVCVQAESQNRKLEFHFQGYKPKAQAL